MVFWCMRPIHQAQRRPFSPVGRLSTRGPWTCLAIMSVTLSVLEELLTHREGAFLVDGVADEASEADARFISAGLHAVRVPHAFYCPPGFRSRPRVASRARRRRCCSSHASASRT